MAEVLRWGDVSFFAEAGGGLKKTSARFPKKAGTTNRPPGRAAQAPVVASAFLGGPDHDFSAGFLTCGSPPAATPSHARGTMASSRRDSPLTVTGSFRICT